MVMARAGKEDAEEAEETEADMIGVRCRGTTLDPISCSYCDQFCSTGYPGQDGQ